MLGNHPMPVGFPRIGATPGHRHGGVRLPYLGQARVNGDAKPILNIMEARKMAALIPGAKVIEGASEERLYDIHHGLVAWRDVRHGDGMSYLSSPGGMMSANMPYIFVHFGGIQYNMYVNAIHMAEGFRINGICITTEAYSDKMTAALNVTVTLSGTVTVFNNGNSTIYAGECVLALPPHPDDPRIQGFAKLNPGGYPGPGRISGESAAQHSRFVGASSIGLIDGIAGGIMNALRLGDNYSLRDDVGGETAPNVMHAHSPSEEMGRSLRMFILGFGALLLDVYSQSGMITLNSHADRAAQAGFSHGRAITAGTRRTDRRAYELMGFMPVNPTVATQIEVREAQQLALLAAIGPALFGPEQPIEIGTMAVGALALKTYPGTHREIATDMRRELASPFKRLMDAATRSRQSIDNCIVGKSMHTAGPGGEFTVIVGLK